jgi:hypothetical protein
MITHMSNVAGANAKCREAFDTLGGIQNRNRSSHWVIKIDTMTRHDEATAPAAQMND